jgi:hypothetical protein
MPRNQHNNTVIKPLFSITEREEFTAQPHPTHTTASSFISLPHLLQNIRYLALN